MAAYTVSGTGFPTGTGEKTLSGTTHDTVTISPLARGWTVEVHNIGGATIDFTASGTTAVAGAAGTVRVPAGQSVSFPAIYVPGGVLSIVGDGNAYAVNLIPAS